MHSPKVHFLHFHTGCNIRCCQSIKSCEAQRDGRDLEWHNCYMLQQLQGSILRFEPKGLFYLLL